MTTVQQVASGRLGATIAERQVATPLGSMLLAATAVGLASAAFSAAPVTKPDRDSDHRSELQRAEQHLDEAAAELAEYFSGTAKTFDVTLDLTAVDGFQRHVLDVARRIPFGRVATYGEVAGGAGNARAARAAGNALGDNPVCIIVPCHRVVPRHGGLGGYTGGVQIKEWLLRFEGVSLL